jgi:hypothetical protein
MRRIIIIGTALAVVAMAASAYGAGVVNRYTATDSFNPSKAGSKSKPVPVGIKLSYTASGTLGNRTAPLIDIGNTFYGVVSNGKDFPTCTVAQITAALSDKGCAKGSEVATGALTALIGAIVQPMAAGTRCNKNIHVYNAGQGKLAFFLADKQQCPIVTLPPFPGTLKAKGGTLVLDAPTPAFISFPLPGIEGSLLTEQLNYIKQSKKGHGFFEAVGCKSGRRAYTTTFKTKTQTVTIPGKASCS